MALLNKTTLNKKQYIASLPGGGIQLLIAGAGTGKTKTLVEKVKNIIASGMVKPENILILTFSRMAAEEIRERVKLFIGDSAGRITAGTFHSFCLRLLRDNSRAFTEASGFKRFPEILDDDRRRELKLGMLTDSLDSFMGLPADVVFGLSENMADCDKKTLKELKQLGVKERLDNLNRRFMECKRERGLIDFNDMMNYAILMLERDDSIRMAASNRYRYILVDEFQDTSEDNFRLLKLLLPDGSPNLFMVGDDWQSIYGFRGSRIDYIIKSKRFFPDVNICKLKINYRSMREVVNLSNDFIRKNRFRTRKKLKSFRGRGGVIRDYPAVGPLDEVKIINDILINEPEIKGSTAILYRNNWQGDFILKRLGHLEPFKSGKISAMTMHSSKGLEFDNVIIAGISDKIIPDKSNNIEEERRLLYVALTRARERLYIIHYKQDNKELSLFARELGLSVR